MRATANPTIAPIGDGNVVDARFPSTHQAVVVEFPEFIAVTTEPLACIVMPLVLESHRDAALDEGPKRLHQTIVQFALPFPSEELLNVAAATYKLIAVPPNRVGGIAQGYANRIARVPGIFCSTHLGCRSFQRERWSNGSGHRRFSFICKRTFTPGKDGPTNRPRRSLFSTRNLKSEPLVLTATRVPRAMTQAVFTFARPADCLARFWLLFGVRAAARSAQPVLECRSAFSNNRDACGAAPMSVDLFVSWPMRPVRCAGPRSTSIRRFCGHALVVLVIRRQARDQPSDVFPFHVTVPVAEHLLTTIVTPPFVPKRLVDLLNGRHDARLQKEAAADSFCAVSFPAPHLGRPIGWSRAV